MTCTILGKAFAPANAQTTDAPSLVSSNFHIMGQTLSEPVTSKESACCQNSQFRVGSSCMQGWRINMEDSHTHILSLPDDPDTAFFAVYDGHGGIVTIVKYVVRSLERNCSVVSGAKVAEYAGKHLHKYITKRPEYKEGNIVEALKQVSCVLCP